MSDYQEHWDKVFTTKAENEMSWFQAYPETSMALVNLFKLPLTANIIDVGGGHSHFVDALLDKGYQNIWVLDISTNAIERAKRRLGERASKINWIVSDITKFKLAVEFDFWHDRAAFHFLITKDKIYKYLLIAEKSIRKNGYLVIGTFSETGPTTCSGLAIKQYSQENLPALFERSFNIIKCFQENHITPFDTNQNFLFCSFQKK